MCRTELYDITQRLRFEHPEVRAVVLTGGKEKVFCAGANIRMLAGSAHGWKVNFCKFTNETRNGIEDATENSAQTYLAAVNGTASGGGYELALACAYIMLVDDRSAAVSLPELPLLGVLPGAGGLTRLIDKRHVRRDRADYVATHAEGVGGRRAVAWRLVDEAVPRTSWDATVAERAAELAAAAPAATGIALTPLDKTRTADAVTYPHVAAVLDRDADAVRIQVTGPDTDPPPDMTAYGTGYHGEVEVGVAATQVGEYRAETILDDLNAALAAGNGNRAATAMTALSKTVGFIAKKAGQEVKNAKVDSGREEIVRRAGKMLERRVSSLYAMGRTKYGDQVYLDLAKLDPKAPSAAHLRKDAQKTKKKTDDTVGEPFHTHVCEEGGALGGHAAHPVTADTGALPAAPGGCPGRAPAPSGLRRSLEAAAAGGNGGIGRAGSTSPGTTWPAPARASTSWSSAAARWWPT